MKIYAKEHHVHLKSFLNSKKQTKINVSKYILPPIATPFLTTNL